jgi:DNA (cytosine-5)-methyltransferase 1
VGFTSIEICAGGGGQALGLEEAGFEHLALVEIDPWARATLKSNRPKWYVPDDGDVLSFDATPYKGELTLLAGGVPCPPFSVAGKRLGRHDERDLFPRALEVIEDCEPRAVMLENVRGLLDPIFAGYRRRVERRLRMFGYQVFWKLLNASDFGVPQLRPRTVLVALDPSVAASFKWPDARPGEAPTVGEALLPQMASCGWQAAENWAAQADRIAPTLVGGSKKHGGPDLGPTRAKREWAALGVDGLGLADEPPGPSFEGKPRLTVPMTAILQGFPSDWEFVGRKTPAYRQVGNAFPPPVARAVGKAVIAALASETASLAEAAA